MGMNSLILGILRRDPYKEVLYFPTFSSGKRAQMIRYETLFYFLYNYNISKKNVFFYVKTLIGEKTLSKGFI